MSNDPTEIAFWLTCGNRTALFEKQEIALRFSEADIDAPVIEIDADRTYQTMDGFGFALTGGSASLIGRLEPERRNALLQELFSTGENGLGVSCLRLSIGASDLSAADFSYDDLPPGETDPNLKRFDLMAGDAEVVPMLKEILAVNPAIRIIATPWSAPAWMKTSQSSIGGSLKPECHGIYAQYFVKYIQAMRAQGIPIHAVTPQNEPRNGVNQPSMVMEAEDQAYFIGKHLGPALRAAGLNTEIFCWDHNCDTPEYPLKVLGDHQARIYAAGSAWHLYGGEIDALSRVREAHPDKKIYFTEQWVGAGGQFAGDLLWHAKNVLIGATRNWSGLVLEWNLAGDSQRGPHTPGGATQCVGALTVDGQTVARNVAYYLIAHASKFVPPGSARIESNPAKGLRNVAFATPAGNLVVIALNESDEPRRFALCYRGKNAAVELAGGALGTFVWRR
jgi:glucosylceramidase